VPTIVYWPGIVKPGVSSALVNQVDLYASFASLAKQKLNPADAPDSFNYMQTWLGNTKKGRDIMLEEAFTLAVRNGDWKYIDPVSKPTPDWLKNKREPNGLSHSPQLYNLKTDIGETKNLAASNPALVKKLKAELDGIKNKGTRPGYKK